VWRWPARWSTIPSVAGRRAYRRPGRDHAGRVFDLIERLHATHGLTSILVTHNLDLAARCTRALRWKRESWTAAGWTIWPPLLKRLAGQKFVREKVPFVVAFESIK